MQRGRMGGENSFDPFHSSNDVNNNPNSMSSYTTNSNTSNTMMDRGASRYGAAPPLQRYTRPGNVNDNDEDEGVRQQQQSSSLRQQSSGSNLSSSGDGGRGSGPGDYGNNSSGGSGSGGGGGGGGVDHFQNFSFTSPQILQQYLALRSANHGSGDGEGRPPHGP